MVFILTDGPPPEQPESPLGNIFDHAFPLADELSKHVNDSVLRMVKENKEFKNMSDAIIAHSIAMMLIICMMNREVLDTNDLDMTFRKVKGITEQYIKHLLTMRKESTH
jgi:hypothetical protein